jgi:nucleoside-diphosphate-sugar epimerase
MIKVLVTGVTGFAGSHLAEYLLARGDVEVYGACRWRSRLDNLFFIDQTMGDLLGYWRDKINSSKEGCA